MPQHQHRPSTWDNGPKRGTWQNVQKKRKKHRSRSSLSMNKQGRSSLIQSITCTSRLKPINSADRTFQGWKLMTHWRIYPLLMHATGDDGTERLSMAEEQVPHQLKSIPKMHGGISEDFSHFSHRIWQIDVNGLIDSVGSIMELEWDLCAVTPE